MKKGVEANGNAAAVAMGSSRRCVNRGGCARVNAGNKAMC